MRPTLFEFAGGEPAFLARAEAHHDRGDQSSVLRLHAGNGDISDLGRRFVDCFVLSMDDAGLPGDPAFRASMTSYMRWAVDDMLAHPDSADTVPAGSAMPRWGWDGLQA